MHTSNIYRARGIERKKERERERENVYICVKSGRDRGEKKENNIHMYLHIFTHTHTHTHTHIPETRTQTPRLHSSEENSRDKSRKKALHFPSLLPLHPILLLNKKQVKSRRKCCMKVKKSKISKKVLYKNSQNLEESAAKKVKILNKVLQEYASCCMFYVSCIMFFLTYLSSSF